MTAGELIRRRPRAFITPVLGAAALIAGIVITVRSEIVASTASFGWFAYAPLSDTTFSPGSFSPRLGLGISLMVVGAAIVAFVAGRRLVPVRLGDLRSRRRLFVILLPGAAGGAGMIVVAYLFGRRAVFAAIPFLGIDEIAGVVLAVAGAAAIALVAGRLSAPLPTAADAAAP